MATGGASSRDVSDPNDDVAPFIAVLASILPGIIEGGANSGGGVGPDNSNRPRVCILLPGASARRVTLEWHPGKCT